MDKRLEVGTPSLASFSAFLVMAGACLVLSLYFYRKSRALAKFPESPATGVFDRTFSVFSLASAARQTHHSFLFFLFLSPMSAMIFAFICVFVVLLPFISMGLLLWSIAVAACLSLMMVEEALDARETANTFVRASEEGSPFASGDLRVLSILRRVIPRLVKYYLFLSLLFLISFIAMPYIFSTLLLAWTYMASLVFGTVSVTAIPFAFIPTALILASAMIILFITGRRLKAVVFGFPPSGHLTSTIGGEIRRRLLYEKLHDALESRPEEETW
jgi:hypothetical protein